MPDRVSDLGLGKEVHAIMAEPPQQTEWRLTSRRTKLVSKENLKR